VILWAGFSSLRMDNDKDQKWNYARHLRAHVERLSFRIVGTVKTMRSQPSVSANLCGGHVPDQLLDPVAGGRQLHLHLCERDADHLRRRFPEHHLRGTGQRDLRSQSNHAGSDGFVGTPGELHGDRTGDGVGLDAEHHRGGHGQGDGQPGRQQQLRGGHVGLAELHGEFGRADGDGQQCVASIWSGQPDLHLHPHRLGQR